MKTRLYEWCGREDKVVREYIDVTIGQGGSLQLDYKIDTDHSKAPARVVLEPSEAAMLVKLWLRQWLRMKLKKVFHVTGGR